MIKVLFMIHDLGQGGAEKVLVNLVNNMDVNKYEITVFSLFAGGINEHFLKPHIRYMTAFKKMIPANSKLMKLFTPKRLHKFFIKEKYDIEISYLEGPTARIISGCENESTKIVTWNHCNYDSIEKIAKAFRSKNEVIQCYDKFERIVCVSKDMKQNLCKWLSVNEKCTVLYNTVDSITIKKLSKEPIENDFTTKCISLIAAGSLKEVKGFDRLIRITKQLLNENYNVHLYILGKGPLRSKLESYVKENNLEKAVTFLGYQTNPYKYVKNSDLFICSSHSEGFSTATTEALIMGIPVCTVDVPGMNEMLGDSEYGLITENSEKALFQGIKRLLDNPSLLSYYKKQAVIRGKMFSVESTVKAVEEMLEKLYDELY